MTAASLYNKYKEYWGGQETPGHPIMSTDAFDKYAKEILYYLQDGNMIVDAGCGSAEMLVLIAHHFKKAIGIDYSEKMLQIAKKNARQNSVSNIEFIQDDILNIGQHLKGKADYIYSNAVVQYLNEGQLNEFMAKSRKLLQPHGKLLLMNIPDKKYFFLYCVNFFRTEVPMGFLSVILNYLRFKFWLLRKKLVNPGFNYSFEGSIGYWYSYSDLRRLAAKNDFRIDFTHSIYPPHGYRFHAILYT